MRTWLKGPGKAFRDPLPGSTNYLGAYDKSGKLIRTKQQAEDGKLPAERRSDLRPYPQNPYFRSEPVLSEEFRELIYDLVVNHKHDIVSLAAGFSIDTRRVAAVARLKAVEKQWEAQNKPLATAYAEAVLAMLPQTYSKSQTPHESVNDLPVHRATNRQIFYPTSESRQFTREDAAKAFSEDLLPAEKRIPIPQLVQNQRWTDQGKTREERELLQRQADAAEAAEAAAQERKRREDAAARIRVVQGRRWDFVFENVTGAGHRYGFPHEDRKRGHVKIPTSA
ncbi:hypothetical protein K470DRAFT_220214 [Piedraia hortae CBS 480.64]|uniref:Eukaryotic mitochondrial regulator protein-domain-containing protein n=1 Tax=Piedraia hortae CBS 480.64 TaxID=1314780 RepID=A0A6A7BUE2_9PEZI|nr:hypothetical protein K470DRAFT_220214 [Piedraia hortae CBS 480.64]